MPSVEKFKESLLIFDIDQKIIDRIYNGYETLKSSSPKNEKAAFFCRAQKILDEKADRTQLIELMDFNACCKNGTRDKASKDFAKQYSSLPLSEKIKLISGVPNMGNPELIEKNMIKTGIYWKEGDLYRCPCPNFNGLKEVPQMPLSYCLCCAGHFRYHYQNMLRIKLLTHKIVSSPLNSLGKSPCEFIFRIDESLQ